MEAHASAAVGPDGRLVRLRSEAPLVLRAGADALWLVGGAGGPLGGDDLRLSLAVAAGGTLAVRSVAAQVVLPDRAGRAAAVQVHADVDGHLDWAPEPTVLAAGARYHHRARVELGPAGSLRWRDELVLGRHGEAPGRGAVVLRVERAGRPVVHHEVRTEHLEGHRALVAELLVGVVLPRPTVLADRPGGVLQVAADAVLVVGLGPDLSTARAHAASAAGGAA